jgi:hypothetical protein
VARRLGLRMRGWPRPTGPLKGWWTILFDASGQHAATLTSERLFGWHAALFPFGYSGLKQITVAAWRPAGIPMRVVSGTMGKEKIHFVALTGSWCPARWSGSWPGGKPRAARWTACSGPGSPISISSPSIPSRTATAGWPGP